MIYNNFYQVGGDLKFQHPSYIERNSDVELYQAIKNGDFCYVLNCRQMGKSSLAVQIFHRLKGDGYACCFISLSDIGSSNVTEDSWYFTLAHKIARKLRIDLDISDWWKQQHLLTVIGKFGRFIDDILLVAVDRDIAIFIDEIDSIRRLEFSADDFFALIRSCYNQRVDRPEYQRLRFTFLGVASPSSLINNLDCTPFNIGTAIVLEGFKLNEAKLLSKGLEDRTDRSGETIAEILKWTGGQPFLTQKLCKLIAESTDLDFTQEPKLLVEQITRSHIISNWAEQDNPQHLKTIQDRILNRQDLTIKLLWLYKEILVGNEIRSDISPEQVELRLSGLVIDRDSKLKISNLIYQQVFNSNWVMKKLAELSIPYLDKITVWETSSRQDKSQLLNKEELDRALQWANGKNLSSIDWQYLKASETAIITNEKELISRKLTRFRSIGLLIASSLILPIVSGWWFFDKYASCSVYKGIVGEKIGDACFRSLTTSGEKLALVSSSNFYLTNGVSKFDDAAKAFNNKPYSTALYSEAKYLFAQAKAGDPTDPISQIYYNNATARIQGKSLKIAAVVPIDYYENAAIEILRGVADAQDAFNQQRQDKNTPLIEVVIVNDGNKPNVAEQVSKELANNLNILAIVGHHFSDSTTAALPQYEEQQIALVSPTSSSSKLSDPKTKSKVFFPTIISTKEFTKMYAKYFIEQKLTNIAIIDFSNQDKPNIKATENTGYAQAFHKNFEQAIKDSSVKIVNQSDRQKDSIEVIHQQHPNTQAVLAISSGETNSATIALAFKNSQLNSQLPIDRQIKFFATHAIADKQTLDRVGKSDSQIKIVSPCQNRNSQYIESAKTRWKQSDIYWRTGYAYDATQRIVQAIELLSNPTRQNILEKLPSITLTTDRSSGFIRFDPNNLDRNIPGCLTQIQDGKFKKD